MKVPKLYEPETKCIHLCHLNHCDDFLPYEFSLRKLHPVLHLKGVICVQKK